MLHTWTRKGEAVKDPLALPTAATRVALGNSHGAALTAGGELFTFGGNEFGELGRPEVLDSALPGPVSFPTMTRVVSVACGFFHTAAVTDDGSVWTFGWGRWGQLGQPAEAEVYSARPVRVDQLAPRHAVSVTCGHHSTIALDTQGEVLAWGFWRGAPPAALEDGQPTPSQSTVERLPLPGPACAVHAGGAHAVAVLADHTLWVWGSNSHGQLGAPPSSHLGEPHAHVPHSHVRTSHRGRSGRQGGPPRSGVRANAPLGPKRRLWGGAHRSHRWRRELGIGLGLDLDVGSLRVRAGPRVSPHAAATPCALRRAHTPLDRMRLPSLRVRVLVRRDPQLERARPRRPANSAAARATRRLCVHPVGVRRLQYGGDCSRSRETWRRGGRRACRVPAATRARHEEAHTSKLWPLTTSAPIPHDAPKPECGPGHELRGSPCHGCL